MAELGIAEVNRRVRAELSDRAALQGGVAFDPDSPLQYRGLAHVALTSAAQQAEAEKKREALQKRQMQNVALHPMTGAGANGTQTAHGNGATAKGNGKASLN